MSVRSDPGGARLTARGGLEVDAAVRQVTCASWLTGCLLTAVEGLRERAGERRAAARKGSGPRALHLQSHPLGSGRPPAFSGERQPCGTPSP